MEFSDYSNYDIDVAAIWLYERRFYSNTPTENRNWDFINNLYESLQSFFLDAGKSPILLPSDEGDYSKRLRKSVQNINDEHAPPDIFISRNHIYSMADPCKVAFNEHNRLAFPKLFILKLRQYFDGLTYLEEFLKYQLKENFKGKLPNFRAFINLGLLQYPDKIDSATATVINEWFSQMEKKTLIRKAKPRKKKTKAPDNKKEVEIEAENTGITHLDKILPDTRKIEIRPIDNVGDNEHNIVSEAYDISEAPQEITMELTQTETPIEEIPEEDSTPGLVEEPVSDDYEPIPGNFSKEEMITLFSFLYKEKSKEGRSFLQEEEVNEIFKNGPAIPKIPATKYKLKRSLTFPKSIVEYFIFKFYFYHTTTDNKRNVLRFFASYIVDFEDALLSKKKMEQWSNNVGNRKPRKMTFALNTYLPIRMQN